jgi:hypothetical protein
MNEQPKAFNSVDCLLNISKYEIRNIYELTLSDPGKIKWIFASDWRLTTKKYNMAFLHQEASEFTLRKKTVGLFH